MKKKEWEGEKRTYWQLRAREVWEDWWGDNVPNGYLIHHVDRDIENNDICNLALVTPSYHSKIHATHIRVRKKEYLKVELEQWNKRLENAEFQYETILR